MLNCGLGKGGKVIYRVHFLFFRWFEGWRAVYVEEVLPHFVIRSMYLLTLIRYPGYTYDNDGTWC